MNPLDIFWISLILIALQPLFRQKVLEYARRRLLARLEKQRSSREIIMVHRQETMAILGIPIFRFIDINDSEEADMPKEVMELMSYFPQPTRTTPAVEYLPIPRRSKPS
ncbi:MAG: hypothetical protein P8X65_04865 [Syntrophobacterales bacterium]|jgi:hypothetical protein